MLKSVFEALEARISGHRDLAIQGLKGSCLPFLVSDMVREGKGPFFVLTPTAREAETLLKDVDFYLGKGPRTLLFPSWEILPYENLSPHPDITGARMNTLYALLSSGVDVVVAPIQAVMQRLIPRSELGGAVDYLVSGEEVPFDLFVSGLAGRGYVRVPQVEELGEFSVRGGIVDIFGPSISSPVRVEFFGDEVESIRPFDLETQRSLEKVMDDLVILPAGESFLSQEKREDVARRIRSRGRKMNLSRERIADIMHGFDEGIPFQGAEFFLPDFYDETATFFDYISDGYTVIKSDPEELKARGRDFELLCREGFERGLGHKWPFPAPEELYLDTEEIFSGLEGMRSISAGGVVMGDAETIRLSAENNDDIRAAAEWKGKSDNPLAPVARRIKEWREDGAKVFFAAHTRGQGERLAELLAPYGLDIKVTDVPPDLSGKGADLFLHIGELSSGFRDMLSRLVIITEEEIFGERQKHRGKLKKSSSLGLTSFNQLKDGDYVVHIDHGIGLYGGLKKVEAGGTAGDYLELEYLGGDKVFVPVDRLNLVQRYAGGESEAARLDRLGSGAWEKVKKRVKKAVGDLAKELMDIYAARAVMEGFSYSKGGEEFREFEDSFEYEETPDQESAIEDVLADMESSRPLDRLVCGDVGYGKTEVAVRASFKAAMDGRQTAVLVPTTILAHQHHHTFTDRFKGYPIVVERLTRFCGRAKHRDVLERLKEGKVDVVIGTHRLLQKDVEFNNLGLVVIDEEQHFGVAHKEKLKKMRKMVDVLTLTATPIPRTLNMAMSGIRDLSIISSPPEGRLAIRTQLAKFDEETIRDAVLRELRRGGQIFFVHNRVHDIENVAARVKMIVPEARVSIGHGQMGEKALEEVMLDFYEGKSDLLVCTTIIESGLDVPSANTIMINNAQNFGLGQLYQLRGRVGRAKHRAYAYLLVPGDAVLTKEARKRLQAIQEMTELSSGFKLASYDLEIRGAGNLLGAEQSGNIDAVGFDLFTSLLEKEVAALKGEGLMEEIEPEVRFPFPAFIPEDYVADTGQRLSLYKRFSSLTEDDELREMRPELLDRFGPLPQPVINFMELISFKMALKKGMVKDASVSERSITFTFHEAAKVNIDKLLSYVRESPQKYSISPDMRFKVNISSNNWLEGLVEAKNILKGLIECDSF